MTLVYANIAISWQLLRFNSLKKHFPRVYRFKWFGKNFPDLKFFSLILAEKLLFFPDFPDWKKSSKFSLNSLISGNPVIFSEVCVKNSVHTGGGGFSRPTPRGEIGGLARGVSRPTPRGVSRPTPRGVQAQGVPGPGLGGVSKQALRQTPPLPADGYCCGRYASYWNAFLLIFKIHCYFHWNFTIWNHASNLKDVLLCFATNRLMPYLQTVNFFCYKQLWCSVPKNS